MTTEQKIERLWDRHEIENLMGRYALYHCAREHENTFSLFADRDDISLACGDMGTYIGKESVKSFFVDWHYSVEMCPEGALNEHLLTSPVIEIAEDGQTAYAVWISPGAETRHVAPKGDLESIWIWGKYGVDFIKEDGVWKFWHFTITQDFSCDYHHSWVECEKEHGPKVLHNGKPKSDCPCDWEDGYTKELVKVMVPAMPMPYKTWEDKE